MKIVMSSGHGKYISGAVGPSPWGIHEHTEAVKVVDQTAIELRKMGVDVITYEDTVSKTQSENLDRLISFHNDQGAHDLDVSVHFNSTDPQPSGPVGHEVWYKTSSGLTVAKEVCDTVCSAVPFKNRGPKQTDSLAFLNGTAEVAVLIEVCFVNSHPDVDIYNGRFDDICAAIASGLASEEIVPTPEPEAKFQAKGRCSWFGGPDDTGVSPSEGLAFIYNYDDRPDLFLDQQPPGTTGLARRLDPDVYYVACRWDYDVTPKTMLDDKDKQALVRAGGLEFLAWPADWGPNENTGRVADISPGLMEALEIGTDDEVEVIYPYAGVAPAPEEAAVVRIETEGEVEVWVNGKKVT
jgi:N-acetylmuramoyl-L-alanine amidase